LNTRPPRVSIGLPVYNGELFLAQAIDSLLAQTYTDFELILSDNASTDGTEAICRDRAARDPRVRYERSDVNRGATWNFNRVFELSRGEYFKWAAHDDAHEPTSVARCVEALDRYPDVALAFTRLIDIDENGQRTPVRALDLPWDSPRAHQRFRALVDPRHRCESIFGLVRPDVLRATGLVSDYSGCDRVLLAHIALMGRFHEVPEVLFLHREHRGRSTRHYKDPQARTEWFNPTRGGRPNFPRTRMLRGYLRAIRAARIPWTDRLVCRAILIPWIVRNRHGLWRDYAFALACMIRGRWR
jgi:glycosyltransferase involved in cell wall biosynthesis